MKGVDEVKLWLVKGGEKEGEELRGIEVGGKNKIVNETKSNKFL